MHPKLLAHIVVFVQVAKAESFSLAAEALGMPKSSVSRSVAALERELGLRLIHRTTRALALTVEGRTYFEYCQKALEEIALAHEHAQTAPVRPRGHLRMAAPIDFTVRLTPARVKEFLARYPDVTLDLHFTPRWTDPLADRYDVTVRMGEMPDSSLLVRRVGTLPRALYAAPSYTALHGTPESPSDLSRHQCILRSERGSLEVEKSWSLKRGGKTVTVAVAGRASANNVGFIRGLAVEGAGVAVLAEAIASPDVEAGRLIPVLQPWRPESLPVFAVTASRLPPAKTRILLEFLGEVLTPFNRA